MATFIYFFCRFCFAHTAKAPILELIAEADPIPLARVSRVRRNAVDSSTEKPQDAKRESVERGNSDRAPSASSTASDNSTQSSRRSFSSITGLMSDDYYLHPFRHTRTSVYKEVCCSYEKLHSRAPECFFRTKIFALILVLHLLYVSYIF